MPEPKRRESLDAARRGRAPQAEGKVEVTSRDQILSAARAALDRREGDPVPPPPPVLLSEGPQHGLVAQFTKALEALAGKVVVVRTTDEAEAEVHKALNGRKFLRSIDPYSREAIA